MMKGGSLCIACALLVCILLGAVAAAHTYPPGYILAPNRGRPGGNIKTTSRPSGSSMFGRLYKRGIPVDEDLNNQTYGTESSTGEYKEEVEYDADEPTTVEVAVDADSRGRDGLYEPSAFDVFGYSERADFEEDEVRNFSSTVQFPSAIPQSEEERKMIEEAMSFFQLLLSLFDIDLEEVLREEPQQTWHNLVPDVVDLPQPPTPGVQRTDRKKRAIAEVIGGLIGAVISALLKLFL